MLDVPSRLADLLAEDRSGGRPDSRHRSTFGPAPTPSCRILPSPHDGPVLSVTLFSRVALAADCRVALDAGSRTSAALAQILLRKRYGVRSPRSSRCPWKSSGEDCDADAVLLIGDRAMRACLPGFAHAYDLGQEWYDWTGLPFVYAVWAVRDGVDLGPVAEALTEAKRRGCATHGRDCPTGSSALGPGRGLLPALPCQHHSFRPGAARAGRPAILLFARMRARFGPARREPGILPGTTCCQLLNCAIARMDSAVGYSAVCRLRRRRDSSDTCNHGILAKAVDGGRLSFDEGVTLFECRDLTALARCRRGLPSAAPGALPHFQHRSQHQLHQHLRCGV